jgi:hypothetical protein
MSNTPQGGAIEGNAADDALMVDQGRFLSLRVYVSVWYYHMVKSFHSGK